MRKVFSMAMLIVGTMIGAGFCSGRELVSFFGREISIFVAPVCGACIFCVCVLFLSVGRAVQKRSFGEVNSVLLGKVKVVANLLLLCNSAIVLGAMVAGLDTLFAPLLPLPVAGTLAAVLCVLVAGKGIAGLLNCNGVVVPVIIVALVAVTLGSLYCAADVACLGRFSAFTLPAAVTYVSMNMMLASTVLTTAEGFSKKQILAGSGIAAACITLLLALLIASVNATGYYDAEMPVLQMASALGKGAQIALAVALGVSIFTTMLTAVGGLYGYLRAWGGGKLFSGAVTVLIGVALSRLGFVRVVSLFYPMVGVAGFFYLGVCLAFIKRHKKKVPHQDPTRIRTVEFGGADGDKCV